MAGLSQGKAALGTGKTASGGEPYSPSQSVEPMDWGDNLGGVKDLFKPPPSTCEEEGVPAANSTAASSPEVPAVTENQGQSSAQPGATGEAAASSAQQAGPPPEQDVTVRAREFVKKKRAEEIRDRMGKTTMQYKPSGPATYATPRQRICWEEPPLQSHWLAW
jgi:hypothetical protein